LRRLAPFLLLLASACAHPVARQKMSFDELYSDPAPYPSGAASGEVSPPRRDASQRSTAGSTRQAPESPELRAALATFASQARAARAQVSQGSAVPDAQVLNWRRMNTFLDEFLRRSARKTSSLDVVRTRTSLEAELELDARAYGDIPADLADAVLARMDALAVRMIELRRPQSPRSPSRRLTFSWPVDPVVVTSVFGSRLHPILGTERAHQGLDLAAKAGQLVTAAAQGVVLRAGWSGGHGNQVIVQHDGNVTTRYSHLSRLLVVPGDVVEQGDVLGAAGKTGLATGVHVHFELWREGEPSDPLDELGPTDSGEEPSFVYQEPSSDSRKRQGRRPLGRRPH
jgi:murein DD-endopeptidase MepM/ murein hydrolase activator NlpD